MGSQGTTRGTTVVSGGSTAVPPSLTPNVTVQPVNQDNPQVQSQAPDEQNTPVTPNGLQVIANMTDDELAANVVAARNVQMPNFLADRQDITQQFVFQTGLNDKPMVLDDTAFNQYMQDNNIQSGEILARSVNGASFRNQQGYNVQYTADEVQDILKYSRLTYIGGKHGGQVYGAGAYFAMSGKRSTGYGGNTAYAVLNPQTAKIISKSELFQRAGTFAQSHPKFTNAIGRINTDNLSVWALAMGYNVITDHNRYSNGSYIKGSTSDYYNIIDRSALVYLK